MSTPTRTCTGCGRKAPKDELVRFVAPDRTLMRDSSGRTAGRGAYTCASAACFERAVARRAFARTLQTNVRIPTGLNPFPEDD